MIVAAKRAAIIRRSSASLTRPLATRMDHVVVALAVAAHCLQPVDHAAPQQSRIANTTIMVIEFH